MAGHVAGAPGVLVLEPCAAQLWRLFEDLELDRARQVLSQFISWLLLSGDLFRADRLIVSLPMRMPEILVPSGV